MHRLRTRTMKGTGLSTTLTARMVRGSRLRTAVEEALGMSDKDSGDRLYTEWDPDFLKNQSHILCCTENAP